MLGALCEEVMAATANISTGFNGHEFLIRECIRDYNHRKDPLRGV